MGAFPAREARMKNLQLRHVMSGRMIALFVAALIALLRSQALAAQPHPMADATYIGEKACLVCHVVEGKHFGHTVHAKAFRLNPRNDNEKRVCEACHGPGSKHQKEPTKKEFLIGFTKESGTPIETQNSTCMGCHTGAQRLHWPGSAHANNKLACSDCHNPMARFSANGLLKKPSINETCETCHRQARAEFNKRSHMPLPEGKMSCVDCHNPHGSGGKVMLKTDSLNDTCYQCHAEKRGPFIWEHAPVRENCMNCHHPHGSNHDKLLQAARPFLCEQCHNVSAGHAGPLFNAGNTALSNRPLGTAPPPAGLATSQRLVGRACQNCHVQIHGSNHPSGARFQR
jgi:DmsE family decaheme c-type cytochrome